MLEATRVQWLIYVAVMVVLLIAPGYNDRPPPERPKRGFWQASDVLWPLRRPLRGLWPANPALLMAYRRSLGWAAMLGACTNLAVISFPAFAKAMTPRGLVIESLIITILFGRAWGFWSADRKLKKAGAMKDGKAAVSSDT